MNLTIFDDSLVEFRPDGSAVMENPMCVLWEGLAKKIDGTVTLSAPSRVVDSPVGVNVDQSLVKISSRPGFEGPVELFGRPLDLVRSARSVVRDVRRSDCILVRLPSILALVLLLAALATRTPVVAHRKGRWTVLGSSSSIGVRLATAGVAALEKVHDRAFAGVPMLVMGESEFIRRNTEAWTQRVVVSLQDSRLVAEPRRTPVEGSRETRLLFVGRLSHVKGVDLIIRAVLISQLPLRLTIAGTGPAASDLADLVDELGLGDRVSFLGVVANGEDVDALYASHDVLVLASYSEGLPKVLVEAAHNAVPAITTDVGEIRSTFEDALTYFDSGDHRDLALRLEELILTADEYERKSAAIAAWAQTWSLASTEAHFLSLISMAKS